jgi:membrane fusion protein, multidrug efflux system
MLLDENQQAAELQPSPEASELGLGPALPRHPTQAKVPAPGLLLPDGNAVPDWLRREAEEKRTKGRDKRRGLLGRHPIATPIAGVLFALIAGGGYLYWDNAGHFETTDDAFIAARQFGMAPKVPGYLTAVPVTDNQHVVAGQTIAQIDQRDYKIALEQADAQVAAAQASIENIDAQIAFSRRR